MEFKLHFHGEELISSLDFIKMVIISALVGGLIGVERQQKNRVLAGTRTFALTSMLGTLSVLIATMFNIPNFISAAFIGMAFVGVLLGYLKNIQLDDPGVTTVIAFLITYLLGILVGKGMFVEALGGSIIVSVILVSKYNLHSFTDQLSHEEFVNALEFGIIAFVLYPIVPDRAIDPYGLLNPRILVLIIIVVSSIGFVAFLSLRKLGLKGLPVAGLLGSLVNSVGTASSLSIRAKENDQLLNSANQGILLSDVVMLLRNLVIVGIVSLAILEIMLVPQMAMILIGLAYFYIKSRNDGSKEEEIHLELESPFAIYPAIKFGIMITIVSIVVKLVQSLGVGGIYFASLIGGLVSSAAVTGSLVALYSTGSLNMTTVAIGSVITSIGSILSRLWICKTSGTEELYKSIITPTVVLAVVGTILLYVFTVL